LKKGSCDNLALHGSLKDFSFWTKPYVPSPVYKMVMIWIDAVKKSMFGRGQSKAFAIGDHVRIIGSLRSPLPGHSGTIVDLSPNDQMGEYLVQFNSGLQFRYSPQELAWIDPTDVLKSNTAFNNTAAHPRVQ